MNRQHKLLWISCHKMWYNMINDNNKLRMVQKSLQDSSSMGEKTSSSLLFKNLQIRMEQNFAWLLERQENASRGTTKYVQKSCRFFWRQEWSLERWKKNRQIRIFFNMATLSSFSRWRWIYQRAPFSHRKTNWSISNFRGGSTSC